MDGKARLQCRLWWPRHLRFRPSCHTNLLLGWASGDSQSVDLVVATACSNAVISSDCFDPFLQVMLRCATNRLPSELQGRATFSVIGECFSPCSEQGSWNIRDSSISSGLITLDYGDKRPVDSWSWSQGEPGCSEVGNEHPYKGNRSRKNRADIDVTGLHRPRNGFPVCEEVKLEKSYKATMVSDTWIELLVQPAVLTKNLLDWIPHIHKLRVQGISCIPDFHLILYEQPKLASHHFSIRPWSYVSQASQVQEALMEPDSHLKKAEWVTELEKHRDAPNIDLVVLQLNCAVAAEQSIKHFMASLDTPCKGLSLSSILTPLYRHLIAATAALLATLFYIIVQAGSCLLKIWPFMLINALFAKLLKLTYRNIRIRCYELTGWPVILLWRGCGRDQPNIAAAHRTALVRHSTWSAIIFDLVFGILAGSFFLCYQSAINHYIRSMVRSLTDDILRTGCIWLMGVPAGFKLNTELAGILGLVSLNVIQVWSTLLYLLKPVFGPLLYMLAISGMLLGITVPAAMIADMLFLATIHISSLHQLVAFLYSNQLQALAALWRLFRGRKRNALRGRIDTYDYSVEQHVVGSLMFTPLLLLLPTTSVFYIFFTMLYTSLSIVRFSLQIFIAILHCFPYAQVAIWLAQPRRFPSGIWFENLPAEARFQQVAKQLSKGQGQSSGQRRGSSVPAATQRLITSLGIKTASIGEMLFPYMKQLGGGLTWSSCALCIYKIFSGERWPSSVELGAPVLPPWTTCTVRRFWWLCYDAVLASI